MLSKCLKQMSSLLLCVELLVQISFRSFVEYQTHHSVWRNCKGQIRTSWSPYKSSNLLSEHCARKYEPVTVFATAALVVAEFFGLGILIICSILCGSTKPPSSAAMNKMSASLWNRYQQTLHVTRKPQYKEIYSTCINMYKGTGGNYHQTFYYKEQPRE